MLAPFVVYMLCYWPCCFRFSPLNSGDSIVPIDFNQKIWISSQLENKQISPHPFSFPSFYPPLLSFLFAFYLPFEFFSALIRLWPFAPEEINPSVCQAAGQYLRLAATLSKTLVKNAEWGEQRGRRRLWIDVILYSSLLKYGGWASSIPWIPL